MNNNISNFCYHLFLGASFCLFFIFPSSTFSKINSGGIPPKSDTLTVLFIGNSLTGYNQMPKTVENLGLAAGKKIYCDSKLVYGTSVVDICNYPETRAKILERDWDYIVIQGDIHSTAFPENHNIIMPWLPYQPIQPVLAEMKSFISQYRPDAQIVFFMPWAYEDGMTWVAEQTDTYETMQQKICENSILFADELEILVAPVGWAWNTVWNESPTINLFRTDYVHPNENGSYLAACVFYCTFFLEECDGNSFLYTLTQSDADYFQQVASRIVMDDLILWNLETSSGINDDEILSLGFSLNQNYPNPFNPVTKISFNIHAPGKVSIKIYNVLSCEIATILDKEISAGFHEIEFNAASLPSGTYFYQLRHKGAIETKKMIILK